jgi:small subunit ribosomal protein S4e
MSHLKRQEVPKNWPISRKRTVYVVKPMSKLSNSIPLLIILRDILKIAQNRREVKRSLHENQILVNSKKIKDEKIGLYLFDTLQIIPLKKSYRINLTKTGKFEAEEINEKENNFKIAKIIDKKVLSGKKTQINLSDGRNFISEIKCNVNDSVLINLKEKKMEKCFLLKENSKVLIFSGKHAGERGIIQKIDKTKKMVNLKCDNSNINVLIKQLIVIE